MMDNNDMIIQLSIPSLILKKYLEQKEEDISDSIKAELLTNSLTRIKKDLGKPTEIGQIKVIYQQGRVILELESIREFLKDV